MLGGNPLIDIGESASDSNACPSGTTVKNSGAPLVAVGGTPIPLAGCGANTPGELINIAPLLAIACNADSNAAVGAITNTGLVGTVLDNAGTPTAMITGADTGASAQPPAQAVLGVRQASPAKAGAPPKAATTTGAKGTKKAHVPAAAKKARPLKASKASGLPYTGTDLVVVLFLAACLLSIGTALRARTRLRG
jgi:cobalamin biosynthesis Mg chelatase CobN